MSMRSRVSSVLRYPGGKSKALKTILDFVPPHFKNFREPFVGGGSVFIAIKQKMPDCTNFSINDINSDLYYFWKFLQEDGEIFKDAVISMKNQFNSGKDLFKYYRNKTCEWSEFERAIRFFILNRITFSGLIDSGGYSQESYDKRFTSSMIDKLVPLSNLLNGVKITNNDYTYLLNKPGDNVFIFLDPPYLTSKNSKLYGINGNLHTSFDHQKFAEDVKKCKHKWLLTCDDSPEIRDLFSFAHITPWNLAYGMTNVKKEKLKRGSELLITNYDVSEKNRTNTLEKFDLKELESSTVII
ncbi:Cytosine-specific DNA methyltransferase [Methanosarcina vacuolata Z-761]|uniref:site-specific DNA-methyltransferase (adenine-specific) n=2 Tax=Methanosarcina vacuolata TaxID=2215 RepID=A0A0E3LHR3_9EURY|nr:Cytosine-specific DNA methyltransferase [Methanosarcina vacuolata Z-761]